MSVHPEIAFSDVILRSEATKNLEILHCTQDDKASLSWQSLPGIIPRRLPQR